ncbi:P2Y purinoceptor 4-like isoform X2 [Myxocyprinus asiaticus]|nr:P2Y purinoceptor 4-like isoform X2 [Myxocyprinus asiaticus]XP_051512597.1 P2Y purinoceptor 4-like isoform X2 [Myxocyprinus asiaticus]
MANNTTNEIYTNTSHLQIYRNTTNQTNHWSVLFLIIVDKCNAKDATYVRFPIDIFTFVVALPTNVALLWLLMRGSKALSPSEVLALNLALVNIIFCIYLPLDMYLTVSGRSGLIVKVSEAISILNLFTCPLLLTSMCAERYMAARHAVLYMKLASKWEYRALCSAIIWIFTFSIAVITFFLRLHTVAAYLSIILDFFLLFMLGCLVGIVCVLCKKGPGDSKTGGGTGSSIKNRALKNTVVVLIPTFIIYAPLLALAPYIMTLTEDDQHNVSTLDCDLLNLFHAFPSLGACIGPSFYVARARQLFCSKKDAGKGQTTTQELQHSK